MHTARVCQHLMRLLALRHHVVGGLVEEGASGIDSIDDVDGDARTHIVRSLHACSAILADDSFLPAPIAEAVGELGERFDIDLSAVHTFLHENPMQRSGKAHAERRRLYLVSYAAALKRMANESESVARKHFERLLVRPPRSVVADIVEPYVDEMLRSILAAEDAQGGSLYDELAGDSAPILEYMHHPRKLRQKSAQARAFMEGVERRDEGEESRRVRSAVLLTYALQGRDPMIGGLAAFICHLRELDEEARVALLARCNAQHLFQTTSPVNYIGRTASRAQVIEGVEIAPGDQLLLMLPWANAASHGGRSVAFGGGAHSCAGQALALAITDAFLAALRLYHRRIDWSAVVSEPVVPTVFRQYRTAT